MEVRRKKEDVSSYWMTIRKRQELEFERRIIILYCLEEATALS
jgi:hypothetical protein